MVKALVFDLMGTCTDWFSSITNALETQLPPSPSSTEHVSQILTTIKRLAMDWRLGFFQEIHSRFTAGLVQEDIDATHRRVLDRLLSDRNIGDDVCNEQLRNSLVQSWHVQRAWPDSIDGLERLKAKFFVVVLANGTTRLQLDIVQSSGLPFHALFSSQLLGLTKPDPKIYLKCTELLNLKPEECLMVAAHAYDLRAAATIGMKTAYVQRTTEDPDEDMKQIREENDYFFDAASSPADAANCGLSELARVLGC